jgi:hypothetical protein
MAHVMDSTRQGASFDAAFTTRPRRLLMVGRIQPGREVEILDLQQRLPFEAAANAGIDAVEAFVGSGHYAVLLEIDADDAQSALAAFMNDPRVQEFHATLQPLVSGFPSPDWQYAASDRFHPEEAIDGATLAATGPAYSSADLPLAASVVRWMREGGG